MHIESFSVSKAEARLIILAHFRRLEERFERHARGEDKPPIKITDYKFEVDWSGDNITFTSPGVRGG